MMKHALLTTAVVFPLSLLSGDGFAGGWAQKLDKDLRSRTPILITIGASDEVVQGAQNFIQNVSSRGLNFLKNKQLSEDQRKKEFRTLLRDSFDLKTIARFAMGRYWRQATDEQKKEYMSLFEDMVIDTYSQRFAEYQGQDISIDKARAEGDKDAIVNSQIVSGNGSPNVLLDWRVRYKDGEYRIVDVLVEGVSMTLTQRSEFSSIIQRGGGNIEALLAKLRDRK
ncbi:MAG: ABC transporter substrate-binding protein [Rhodospirillales bacterium]|nr:ABC transporter substrate-binding protein [Rhodospirillales bacterium]MCB9979688.1 ABC transporter substrate-binding protein [Rhodospirillales bacterium]